MNYGHVWFALAVVGIVLLVLLGVGVLHAGLASWSLALLPPPKRFSRPKPAPRPDPRPTPPAPPQQPEDAPEILK